MTIDGRYYTEPELAAKFRGMQETIQRLDGENYKLTEKLEEIGTAYNEQVSLVGWYENKLNKHKEIVMILLETARASVGTIADASDIYTNSARLVNAIIGDDM